MEEGDFISSLTAWIANSKGPLGSTDFAAGLFVAFMCPAGEPQEAEL